MNKKLFCGFTLAELVVAMAIVGSVAALTLPPLISNHQNKVLQMSFQKAYRDLDNNLEELQASNYRTTFYNSLLTSTDGITDFFANYYNRAQTCETTAQPCFASQYASISNPSTDVAFELCNNAGVAVQLKDNTAICIIPAMASFEIEANPAMGIPAETIPDSPATVYLDVNGSEPPNIGGRDMFTFQIDNFRIVDNNAATSCITSSVGAGCLNHIIADRWKVRY